jgi:hypothetical protein
MQMRSRDLIKNSKLKIQNGGGPRPKKPILQLWKEVVHTMLFLLLKNTFSARYIQGRTFQTRPYLSINYQILIFVIQFPEEEMVKPP